MTPAELHRIERQARHMRARVLAAFFRGVFRRTPVVAGARTA